MERLFSLLSSANFMPHGMCFQWRPGVLWLHVLSDAFIVLAYLSIPVALIYFLKRRRDLQFPWVFRLFAAFIFFCAMTHLMAMIVIWEPQYVVQGMVKLATAAVSMATAALLWPLLPKALALPSPAQLALTNRELASAVDQKRRVEQELRKSQQQLEQRVERRTAELSAANARLQTEMENRKDLEKSFASVIEAAPHAFVLVDEPGTITLVNQQAEAIFGYRRDELIGSSLHMLVPERYRAGHHDFFAKFLRDPSARAMGVGRDLRARRKDGSEFPVEIGLAPVKTLHGRFIVSTIIDITERLEHLQQLRRQTEELTALNEDLQRTNQELNDFAYIASHDLKEPLRGIRTYADYLLEEYGAELDDDASSKLREMEKLCERSAGLISDLLRTSRVAQKDLHQEVISLDAMVDDVLDSLQVSLAEKKVEIRRPPALPHLRCDRVLVTEVLRNLIANAIKYNDRAAPWIEISAEDPAGNPAPVITVRDNGIGIRERHLESVFRMFKRLHGRSEYGGGTGAGLAIVKKIIERHNGRIWVESTYGEGSSFRFTLGHRQAAAA